MQYRYQALVDIKNAYTAILKDIEKKDRGYCFCPFYDQITPYDVIRWLFNFDDEDTVLVVQMLERVIFLSD